jgi:site-specific DNA-methyltransferase (adenine-specific)
MDLNTIQTGDCREVLPQVAPESIAACLTDPPYNYEFIGRKWDDAEVRRRLGRVKESSTLVKNIPYGSGLAGGTRNPRWYERNRQNVVDYQEWCEQWGKQLYRVCKAGAPVAVFSSTRTAAHIQVALEEAGFYARDVLVYRRHAGIPKGLNAGSKLRKLGRKDADAWEGWHSCFRNEWEAIVLVQKPLITSYLDTIDKTGVGLFKTVNRDGSFQSNILEGFGRGKVDDNPRATDSHCTVKPLGLMMRLIDLLVPKAENNVILDPFAGTGTTLLAAKRLGYQYIGIEIESRYVRVANKRLGSHSEVDESQFSPLTGTVATLFG